MSRISSLKVEPNKQLKNLSVKLDSSHVEGVTLENNKCIINYHFVDDMLDFKGYLTIYFKDGNWELVENFDTVDFSVDWSKVSHEIIEYERYNSTRFYEWNTNEHYKYNGTTYVVNSVDSAIDWYDIEFNSYDSVNEKISGELIICAGGYHIGDSWKDSSYESIILTIPFDTSFDVNTGKFVVNYTDELETYIDSSLMWLSPSNYYTTADCHAEIVYNFGGDWWQAEFFVDFLYNNPIEVEKYTKSTFGFTRNTES